MLNKTKKVNIKKQIAITKTATGAVMYTVPAGKEFKGYIVATSNSSSVMINGIIFTPFPTSGYNAIEQIFTEGTTIVCNTSNVVSILGIEYDA